jgi:hypothetical protein
VGFLDITMADSVDQSDQNLGMHCELFAEQVLTIDRIGETVSIKFLYFRLNSA